MVTFVPSDILYVRTYCVYVLNLKLLRSISISVLPNTYYIPGVTGVMYIMHFLIMLLVLLRYTKHCDFSVLHTVPRYLLLNKQPRSKDISPYHTIPYHIIFGRSRARFKNSTLFIFLVHIAKNLFLFLLICEPLIQLLQNGFGK